MIRLGIVIDDSATIDRSINWENISPAQIGSLIFEFEKIKDLFKEIEFEPEIEITEEGEDD